MRRSPDPKCSQGYFKIRHAIIATIAISLSLISSNSYAISCNTMCGSCGLFEGAELDACQAKWNACVEECMKIRYGQPPQPSYNGNGQDLPQQWETPFIPQNNYNGRGLNYIYFLIFNFNGKWRNCPAIVLKINQEHT